MKICFKEHQEQIKQGIIEPKWDRESGTDEIELNRKCRQIAEEMHGQSHTLVKAQMIVHLLDNLQLSYNSHDLFADRLNHGDIIKTIRLEWQHIAEAGAISKEYNETLAGCKAGAWDGIPDYSHTAPDWDRLLDLGFVGIIRELRTAKEIKYEDGSIDNESEAFFNGCIAVWEAMLRLLKRMSRHIRRNADTPIELISAELVEALSERPPHSLPEALEMICLIFVFQNDIEGTLVRSLGRLDQILLKFYQADLRNGRYTRACLKNRTCTIDNTKVN